MSVSHSGETSVGTVTSVNTRVLIMAGVNVLHVFKEIQASPFIMLLTLTVLDTACLSFSMVFSYSFFVKQSLYSCRN